MSGLTKERVIEIANNIVITQYGSVPFLNNFGCNIIQYVDKLLSNDDIDDLKIEIQNQFKLWLPNYLQDIQISQLNQYFTIIIYLKNIDPIEISSINLYKRQQ